jgi:hypothetical protein
MNKKRILGLFLVLIPILGYSWALADAAGISFFEILGSVIVALIGTSMLMVGIMFLLGN